METANEFALEQRIARKLSELRSEQGWSLEALAERSGISRASLSRIERCELSPTAGMLGKLCSIYGWTLSRLMAEAEAKPVSLIRTGEQAEWRDPESGYERRILSPPTPGLRGELVEVTLPSGAVVSFDAAPIQRLEHHLWMMEGMLRFEAEGSRFDLRSGDCLRYVLTGASRFECLGRRSARYLVAAVHP